MLSNAAQVAVNVLSSHAAYASRGASLVACPSWVRVRVRVRVRAKVRVRVS